MYSLNARDHFNCSPFLFSWPAQQNRCVPNGRRVCRTEACHPYMTAVCDALNCVNKISLLIYEVACLYVYLLAINSSPVRLAPHTIHILNQHDPACALVHDSFALTVRWEVPLSHKLRVSKKFVPYLIFHNLKKPEPIVKNVGIQYPDNSGF